jgi:hypothetical protein
VDLRILPRIFRHGFPDFGDESATFPYFGTCEYVSRSGVHGG